MALPTPQLQLEDCDQRWVQRLADAKQQIGAEHERMELQCRRLEAELDRCKEIHAGDLRHLNEKKQLLLQNAEMEKENVRREERRKAELDLEKHRQDHAAELEELRRRHERALSIAQQQADMEADNLRKSHSGEHQLAKLVEQVQGSVAEVERMSRRADSDKTVEWSVRERQLEAREKMVREMESRLTAQSKEMEDQRRRVSELVRHMEDSQVDDREALKLERDRLQDEHARLSSLQQSVRDADRNNKEGLKHAWGSLEDEKHSFQQQRLKMEGELSSHREEIELHEHQQRQETERLKTLHNQVEVARQNASRRIRETEVTIASKCCRGQPPPLSALSLSRPCPPPPTSRSGLGLVELFLFRRMVIMIRCSSVLEKEDRVPFEERPYIVRSILFLFLRWNRSTICLPMEDHSPGGSGLASC